MATGDSSETYFFVGAGHVYLKVPSIQRQVNPVRASVAEFIEKKGDVQTQRLFDLIEV